jgi:tRNA wybutosine-synthesizing protein 3
MRSATNLKISPMLPSIPPSFLAKKSKILASLSRSTESYSDNSPKGSVDAQIVDLIDEINAYEGLVTTSSCAGRVAVFVEGRQDRTAPAYGTGDGADGQEHDGCNEGKGVDAEAEHSNASKVTASPGGKGGGRWLYVSHDPITSTTKQESSPNYFSQLLGLSPPKTTITQAQNDESTPRIIHLTFSPLILHVHCATLHNAKPLLAAAINSGFRESGVQSLKVLDRAEAEKGTGVMVAIRTSGLSFSSVVGVAHVAEGVERLGQVVSEEYLRMCVGIINERFRWNDERTKRFRAELSMAMSREGFGAGGAVASNTNEWENKDDRRRRMQAEGLEKQRQAKEDSLTKTKRQPEDPSMDDLEQNLAIFDVG